MRILIDIGHPAHVHLFKHFAWEMREKGHTILFTCREKEYEIELLRKTTFPFICIGRHRKSKLGKIFGLLIFNIRLLIISLKFKPDTYLSHGSMYAAQVSWLLHKTHISMENNGNMEQIRLYLPFSKVVLTPAQLVEDLGRKQIKYSGYHELAYLHPNRYKPSPDINHYLGLEYNTKYFLLRFVSWNASHDIGQGGLTSDEKIRLVNELNHYGRVYISSENKLLGPLSQYQIDINPERLHDVIAGATFVISEGATIASEAGVLGVPAIYVNSLIRCSPSDLQKYGLVFNFGNGAGILEKAKKILESNSMDVFHKARQHLLSEKIDVTAFLVWFVENYPNSAEEMRKNPEIQYEFR